jgi:hypothetical protein
VDSSFTYGMIFVPPNVDAYLASNNLKIGKADSKIKSFYKYQNNQDPVFNDQIAIQNQK